MSAVYISPFTDFGFKKLFGEEASKPLLIDFLNSLLPGAHIKDLSFRNSEKLAEAAYKRNVIFDIYCENEAGEHFIVEMQKAKQNFFKERPIYYSTFPIREQVGKGVLSFDLKAVFCVGILGFTFSDYGDDAERSMVVHEIKLKNQNGIVFYNKLTYVYLEMPNFNKTEQELVTRLDKWLYFIRNLEDFQSIPDIFKNDVIFLNALENAAFHNLTREEYDDFENEWKGYRDWHNVIGYQVDTAVQKATRELELKAEQEKKAALEAALKVAEEKAEREKQEAVREAEIRSRVGVVRGMKENDVPVATIAKITGLTEDEINRI
jgi:predicted transposase/invertase (TIGR01784 family)